MRANIILSLLLVFGILTQSQGQNGTSHIQDYPNELQALSTIRYNQSGISISGHQNGDLKFEQGGVSMGARVRFGNWQVAVMAPTRLFSADRKGRSLGFQLQLFPKNFLINAGVIRKTGFQNTEDAANSNLRVQLFNQNLKMWHFYVNPIYVFSGNKFSLRSSMQFTQRQLKSSGTFLASLRSEYLRLSGQDLLEENSNINNLISGYNFLQNGVEAGYAYNFVFWDGAFISAMATAGVAHTKTSYKLDEEKYGFQKWQVIPSANLNISAGYNGDKYVAAVQFNYRNRSIHSENIQMDVNDWNIQLTCGFRLYAPKIRRKLDQHGARFAQYFVPVR